MAQERSISLSSWNIISDSTEQCIYMQLAKTTSLASRGISNKICSTSAQVEKKQNTKELGKNNKIKKVGSKIH